MVLLSPGNADTLVPMPAGFPDVPWLPPPGVTDICLRGSILPAPLQTGLPLGPALWHVTSVIDRSLCPEEPS